MLYRASNYVTPPVIPGEAYPNDQDETPAFDDHDDHDIPAHYRRRWHWEDAALAVVGAALIACAVTICLIPFIV